MSTAVRKPSAILVILAFITVYLVWGSTYFFIGKAVKDFPPLIMGFLRFIMAGSLMLVWCLIKGEKLWNPKQVKAAVVTGILLLFIGNGCVIWAEKTIASSLAAVLIASAPIWFVLLDKGHWKENLTNRSTVLGLVIGFVGVVFLFYDHLKDIAGSGSSSAEIIGLIVILVGCMTWAGGSIYSKYNSTGSSTVNTTWQMLAASLFFLPGSFIGGEWNDFKFSNVSTDAWFSLLYLVFFGSILAYSAYVWLLRVRPATQVSTYAYVNPVVAVLLGVFLGDEHMSAMQLIGLGVILASVMLINLAKYRSKPAPAVTDAGSDRPAQAVIKPAKETTA